MVRHNTLSKDQLLQRLEEETEPRTALAAYRYAPLNEDVYAFRDALWDLMEEYQCLGRVYLSPDGINFQANVPESQEKRFVQELQKLPYMEGLEVKPGIQVSDRKQSFYKLQIKIRPKLVADGMSDWKHNPKRVGMHVDAQSFDQMVEDEEVLIVDMRNRYESDIGHFEGAYLPKAMTFDKALQEVSQHLKKSQPKKVAMYCTGGIRCEPASSYLSTQGNWEIYQLQGGIIKYAHEQKKHGRESKFRGKNYVFDERIAEQITDDIVGRCESCGKPFDEYVQCEAVFDDIRRLICPACMQKPEYQELAERLKERGVR